MKNAILHYDPFMIMTPGNHNVPRWKFSMQKCIKSQIYTPFLALGEPPRDLRKKFRREMLKNEVFRKSILTPTPQ